jgi:nicotinamidase-related amidase
MNKSLIVVDLQDDYLPTRWDVGEEYLLQRKKLIAGVWEKVTETLSQRGVVVNITFWKSPVVSELQPVLQWNNVRQLQKRSGGIFSELSKSLHLIGETIETRYQIQRSEYFSLVPKKWTFWYPLKEALRTSTCDIVWVYTAQCVLCVFQDVLYIRKRLGSKTKVRVLGDYCMESYFGTDAINQDRTNNNYDYHGLPRPLWNTYKPVVIEQASR